MKNAKLNSSRRVTFLAKVKDFFLKLLALPFQLLYQILLRPFLYVFSPNVAGGSLYDAVKSLIWGFQLEDNQKPVGGILSFNASAKWSLFLLSATIILLQIAKIVIFTYFCLFEAKFWSDLIGRKSVGFFLAGKWVVALMIVSEVIDFICKRLRAHIISNIRQSMTAMIIDEQKRMGEEKSPEMVAQIIQENVEKYALLGINAFFNVTSAGMFAAYFTYTILQTAPVIIAYALGVALVFKLLIEAVSRF